MDLDSGIYLLHMLYTFVILKTPLSCSVIWSLPSPVTLPQINNIGTLDLRMSAIYFVLKGENILFGGGGESLVAD